MARPCTTGVPLGLESDVPSGLVWAGPQLLTAYFCAHRHLDDKGGGSAKHGVPVQAAASPSPAWVVHTKHNPLASDPSQTLRTEVISAESQ
jgi:hypothetical protein